MNNFLIAGFIVFFVSILTFLSVFIAAIKLRLLPAEPEVVECVDRILPFTFSNAEDIKNQIVTTITSNLSWINVNSDSGKSFAAMSTVAVLTTFMLPPVESVPSIKIQVDTVQPHGIPGQKILPQAVTFLEV